MSGPAKLVKTNGLGARQALSDLVMAWARDAVTGEPRYILELDVNHRGVKCGCECPSCGKPLTAVNAAKTEFLRRPHFRHPEGAQRDECLVLAARVAALRQLQEDGWIDLPRHRRSARVAGLSGEFHEAWVEEAPARIHISQIDYQDRATAVITLDDGKQLRVELTGAPGRADSLAPESLQAPTIYIAIDDPALAGLKPEELRRRARLQPHELCWSSHWNDAALLAEAEVAARALAHFNFDVIPDWLNLPEGLDPTLRRETVLHHEVKRILAQECRLTAPEVSAAVELQDVGRTWQGRWVEEEEELRLACVDLEARYGRLVPDITCEAFGADGHVRYLPLLIEVTVTNPIGKERLDRIRAAGEATLEIDLSMAGGRVNRDELRRLVVDEVAIKRWLFHPEVEAQRTALTDRLATQAAAARLEASLHAEWLAERRAKVLATPIADLIAEYLDALIRKFDAVSNPDSVLTAGRLVDDAADKLSMHGYPEAVDVNLIGDGAILARVLSIMLGRPVGFQCDDLMGVLKQIRQTRGTQVSAFSTYFIAARAYPPDFSPEQREWFGHWMNEVRQSIQAGKTIYLRDPSFDRLLSVLFPEMAAGLAKPFGKLKFKAGVALERMHDPLARSLPPGWRRPDVPSSQSRSDRAGPRLLDTRTGEWWLQGRDLERWTRDNPEAAQAWLGRYPKTDV